MNTVSTEILSKHVGSNLAPCLRVRLGLIVFLATRGAHARGDWRQSAKRCRLHRRRLRRGLLQSGCRRAHGCVGGSCYDGNGCRAQRRSAVRRLCDLLHSNCLPLGRPLWVGLLPWPACGGAEPVSIDLCHLLFKVFLSVTGTAVLRDSIDQVKSHARSLRGSARTPCKHSGWRRVCLAPKLRCRLVVRGGTLDEHRRRRFALLLRPCCWQCHCPCARQGAAQARTLCTAKLRISAEAVTGAPPFSRTNQDSTRAVRHRLKARARQFDEVQGEWMETKSSAPENSEAYCCSDAAAAATTDERPVWLPCKMMPCSTPFARGRKWLLLPVSGAAAPRALMTLSDRNSSSKDGSPEGAVTASWVSTTL